MSAMLGALCPSGARLMPQPKMLLRVTFVVKMSNISCEKQAGPMGERLRPDFDLFKNRPELVYLDTAATSQKPLSVLEASASFLDKPDAGGTPAQSAAAACRSAIMAVCAFASPMLQSMHTYYHNSCSNIHKVRSNPGVRYTFLLPTVFLSGPDNIAIGLVLLHPQLHIFKDSFPNAL
jgi:hypothetical protein